MPLGSAVFRSRNVDELQRAKLLLAASLACVEEELALHEGELPPSGGEMKYEGGACPREAEAIVDVVVQRQRQSSYRGRERSKSLPSGSTPQRRFRRSITIIDEKLVPAGAASAWYLR